MMQTIPVKETRDRLADLINQVEVAGRTFVITKFGKPRAMLVPIAIDKKKPVDVWSKSFGMWKDRKDIKNADEWVRSLRSSLSSHYGRLSR